MGERARWGVGLALPAALVLGLAACSAPESAQDAPTAIVAATADCLAAQVLADLQLASAGEPEEESSPRPDAPEVGRVPDGFHPVQRRRLHPGRHAARLLGHLDRADGKPTGGRPRRARRRPAAAVGGAGRHLQHGLRDPARALAGRRPGPRDPTVVAHRPVRWTAGGGVDGARRARGDGQRAVPGPAAAGGRGEPRPLSPTACGAGRARRSGRGPWSARGWRGCASGGCSAPGWAR